MAGRKALWEELEITRRYADLTPRVFEVVTEMLNSNDKLDKKWAVDFVGKALVKMIPQDVTSGGEAIVIKIAQDISEKHNDFNSSTIGDSKGQAQV